MKSSNILVTSDPATLSVLTQKLDPSRRKPPTAFVAGGQKQSNNRTKSATIDASTLQLEALSPEPYSLRPLKLHGFRVLGVLGFRVLGFRVKL